VRGRSATVSARGLGARRRADLSQKAQVKAGTLDARSGAEEDADLLASEGWRVKLAKLARGHCEHCGEELVAGGRIAQSPGPHRGHWAHVACAAEAARDEA